MRLHQDSGELIFNIITLLELLQKLIFGFEDVCPERNRFLFLLHTSRSSMKSVIGCDSSSFLKLKFGGILMIGCWNVTGSP
jgi:hypothetical protein